jgi:SAM-dependent methyltransferase
MDIRKIIDTRCVEAFSAGHMKNAVHIPLAMLRDITCALPPRHVRILFVAGNAEDNTVCADLIERLSFVDAETVICTSEDSENLERGPPDRSMRLWEPNELLRTTIDMVEQCVGGAGVAFDLGCGTARDMIFLEQRGWRAIGFDNRKKLLKQASLLAALQACSVEVLLFHLNLRKCFPVQKGVVDLVLMSRFLYRPYLMDLLQLPRVGGFLMVSHFLDGCQHTPVGTPSTVDGYLLRHELASLCKSTESSFDIILDEETLLPDQRPICRFLARRLS